MGLQGMTDRCWQGSQAAVAQQQGTELEFQVSRNFRMTTPLSWTETQDLRCKHFEALWEEHLWVWGMQTQSLEDCLSVLFSHLWTARDLAIEQQQNHS